MGTYSGIFRTLSYIRGGGIMAEVLLCLNQISKKFGELVAVDGLSLEIRQGEIFGLLGPNGAGKSTTIHCLIGLLEPDSGQIVIGAKGNPKDPLIRARLGIAPQTLSLYELLTAEENLAFFGNLYGLAGRRLRERMAWALDFVGLENRRNDLVKSYSGGMKRRLNLAAAILHDPEIILLDEPTVGVDPQSRNSIFENIMELNRLGRTILYTTHYMEEAERLCHRVGIMDHGHLLALDTVEGLLKTHGGLPLLVIRQEGRDEKIHTSDPLGELNRRALESPIEQFRLEQATLEQVFLNLTGRELRD
jgi:ABC-2 type transport system ATP-binding protein